MTLLKFQQNFSPASNQISCPLPSRRYASKSFQDDWSQASNRQTFTDLTLIDTNIGLMVKPPLHV